MLAVIFLAQRGLHCRLSLEGVVSKDRNAPYRSGGGKDWTAAFPEVVAAVRSNDAVRCLVVTGAGRLQTDAVPEVFLDGVVRGVDEDVVALVVPHAHAARWRHRSGAIQEGA